MYKRRRNCSSLFRKRKKQFRVGLDIKDVTDNKTFWKTIKPLFADKTNSSNNDIARKRKNGN